MPKTNLDYFFPVLSCRLHSIDDCVLKEIAFSLFMGPPACQINISSNFLFSSIKSLISYLDRGNNFLSLHVQIPSPNVAEGHQFKNAILMADLAGSRVITEDELDSTTLRIAIEEILGMWNLWSVLTDVVIEKVCSCKMMLP